MPQILSQEIKEDKKLKLSVKDFYEELGIHLSPEELQNDDGSVGVEFIINKELKNALGQDFEELPEEEKQFVQLRQHASYPNNYILASLAERSYEEKPRVIKDKNKLDKENIHGKEVIGKWVLLTGAYHNLPGFWGAAKSVVVDTAAHKVTGGLIGDPNGYFGAAYFNPDMQQVIIVHRGTEHVFDGTDGVDCVVSADINGIFANEHVAQIDSSVTFVDKVIKTIKKVNEERGINIQLFITGHSLGAWLAPITAFSAKYLVEKNGYFGVSNSLKETSYHANTVIFDGPGSRTMLERIQHKLMGHCAHSSIIDSLDITHYLSAPNTINACNSHVGETYRIFIDLSKEDKEWIQRYNHYDTSRLSYTLGVMHKIAKIKKVFDSQTGEVLRDQDGNVKILKVENWPSLLPERPSIALLKHVSDFAAAQLAVAFIPVKTVKYVEQLVIRFISNSVSKPIIWHFQLSTELRDFFKVANIGNDFHCDDEPTVERGSFGKTIKKGIKKVSKKLGISSDSHVVPTQVDASTHRTVYYKTQKLDGSHENKRSLNVFTESERQFLEEYKVLQKYEKDLPNTFKLEQLFSDFDEELKGKTIELLEKCEIEGSNISAANLPEFIPYIKRMLHFFPGIKDKTKEAWQGFSVNTLCGIYQSASSLYLESFNRSLSFIKDTDLENFLTSDNLKVLHTTQSNTSLGVVKVCKTFKEVRNNYKENKYHTFLNLDRAFYLGEETFINFLEKIDYQYLLVLECNGALSSKIEGFSTKLYNVLQNNHNIKVILVTEKGSDLSKFISECVVNNSEKCREKNNEVKWNDLTSESQSKLLEKTVIFQGREVPLSAVVNTADEEVLNTIIDPETIVELFENEEIEIGKALPNLREAEDYYVDRKLAKNVKVKEEILQDNTLTDLFAISGISEEKPGSSRFTTLGENAAEDFNNLCNQYPNDNIHWLKRESNGDLIWQKSHGKTLSGLRRYMEIYEPEDKYSTAIKIVDVKDVSKFDERIVVVAAEPGMGKTTALTRLGIKETDNSKWLIRINLIEYKDQLEQRNFAEEGSVIKFLSENNIASNALTERLLGSRLNNSGNVVFLLDGFDEITSQGQTNVINLLKKLQETKVEKVLISTRLHFRNELENSLSTIAYTLKPFSREDQVKFLQKFWQRDLDPSIDSECLDNYINKLLEFVSESIGDKERKFMGIPMQMRMVAEAFQGATQDQELLDHPEYTFPKDFDMLKLYGRFLHVKYLVYFGKRRAENIDLDEDEDWLTIKPTKVHRSLAFKVLFPEMEMGEKLPSEKDKHRVNRVGIAQCIDDRIVFIHRTFAEYFAAGFLADRLDKDKDSKKSKTTIEFLAQELFESENEVVKTFLDYYLAKNRVHATILKGKLDLNDVISLEENVDVTDNLGRTALHYAAQEGYEDIIRILLENGANAEITDNLGKTALHYAARYNRGEQVVSCLLEKAKDCINNKDKNGRTAVYYAAQQGDWDIVDYLLTEKDASVEGLNAKKLLFHYTYAGSLKGIEKVVEDRRKRGKKEINVTAIKDSHDNTLLHIAAQNREKEHLAIVEFLLKEGADVDVTNNSGRKPISYAAEKEHWKIVESLLRIKNTQFNDLSSEQKDLLREHSAQNAHWDIVKLFMEDNGRDNYFSRLGDQQKVELLCYLIRSKDFEIAEFLIGKGTKVNMPDGKGKKPIHYAAENGYWNIVESLLRKNADFNDLNNKKQKPSLLRYSAKKLHWDIVMIFMQSKNNSCSSVDLLSNIADLPMDRDKYFAHLEDEQKMHFLQYTISIGNLEITKFCIERLIQKGKIIDVNTPNKYGKTFLHLAAQDGQLEIVKYLVDEKGADLRTTGIAAISSAITRNKLDVVKFLVKRLAALYNTTPLHTAVKYGTTEVVEYFIENNVDIKNKIGNTPLHLAVIEGKLEVVKYLVEKGACIHIANKNGETPISIARDEGYRPIEKFLLELNNQHKELSNAIRNGDLDKITHLIDNNNVDLNFQYKSGFTPLHIAARKGKFDILKYLIDKGANLRAKDNYGNTILHWTAFSTNTSVLINDLFPIDHACRIHLVRGKDRGIAAWHCVLVDEDQEEVFLAKMRTGSMDVADYGEILCSGFGEDPTKVDANSTGQKSHLCIVKYLVEVRGANFNVKNDKGNTALHLFATSGFLSALKYLIDERGANFDFKNDNDSTPLHFAASHDVAKYLVEKGSNINAKNNGGNTPLHLAAVYLDVAKYLVEKGSNINAKNNGGNTPLHYAAESNKLDVVKYLVEQGADLTIKNNDKKTPKECTAEKSIVEFLREAEQKELLDAARQGYFTAASKLIEKGGVDINAQDDNNWTPLHHAIHNDHLELVKYFLEKGSDVFARNNHDTSLHLAVSNGEEKIIKLVLNKIKETQEDVSQYIDAKDTEGDTSLMRAAKERRVNVMQILLEYYASMEVKNNHGMTALHWAAKNGDWEMVKFLIEEGANLKSQDGDGNTPLHLAVRNRGREEIEIFIKCVRNTNPHQFNQFINARDSKGRTSLHLAVSLNKLDILRLLIEEGADLNAKDKDHNTPLHLAAYEDKLDIVKLLIANGAVYNQLNNDRKTPKELSTQQEITSFLGDIDNLFDTIKSSGLFIFSRVSSIVQSTMNGREAKFIAVRDNEGMTLLDRAVEHNRAGTMQYLIEKKADLNAQDNHGRTALNRAASSGNLEVVKYLVEKGAYLNIQDNYGRTPLHSAAFFGELDVVKLLIEKGADLNIKDNYGYTPLHLAVSPDNFEVVKCLMSKNMDCNYGYTSVRLVTPYTKWMVVKLLIEKGADYNIRDKYNNTPLDTARQQIYYNIAELLLPHQSQVQSHHKQQKAYLHLSGFISNDLQNASIKPLRQGLYLPSFETRNLKINGKCTSITRGLSQAAFFGNQQQFLSNLATSAEIYERLAQGKQISKREEKEIFAFSKLLDNFAQQLDSPMSSLPSALIYTKGYGALNNLSRYIAGMKDDFAIHLVTSNHVVAIYRKGDTYSYFDTNVAFISELKSVDQLMQVVEKGIKSAGYKVGEKGLLVEHFDVEKVNNLLSHEDKQVLTKEIKTERQLLAEQDKEFGIIKINDREVSRVQLYDFGTKINVAGGIPLLINADMNLSGKKFQDHLDKKEVSMTAREYLDSLKNDKNVKQATKFIPFAGSKREISEAERIRFSNKTPSLQQLTKEIINQIFSVIFHDNVNRSEREKAGTGKKPQAYLSGLTVDNQLQKSL